jgi:hypothetical protein
MSQFKFSILGIVEIVSKGGLPTPIVYALSIVLVAIAIRILFGLPIASLVRGLSRALSHRQNKALAKGIS